MQVETFECSEVSAEPIEACEEALAIIASLGLSGQEALTAKQDEKPQTRCPYREITKEETFVYGVLCPEQTKLKDYKASPIPLRVLQIAAHAVSLNIFEELHVWDRASVVVKDPVLVAIRKHPTRSWERTTFILARWGETLETFSVLLQRALEMKRTQVLGRLESVTSKAKMLLDNIDSLEASELIENGPSWTPSF
jgi:hypothetical protein